MASAIILAMHLITFITPQSIQDWIAVAVAATTAAVLIIQKLRQAWNRRGAYKATSPTRHP